MDNDPTEQSLVDVPLAESAVEKEDGRRQRKILSATDLVEPRKGRAKPAFLIKKQDVEQEQDTSDNESPRETLGSHRSRLKETTTVTTAEPESATVAALVSPRGQGRFVGFMRNKQNAMKQTIVKTLGRKNQKEQLAPLEEWDNDVTPEGEANNSPVETSESIVPSVLALPMQKNEHACHNFPGLMWAHDAYNPDAMRMGVCYITNADFGFLPEEESVEGFRVPLQMVAAINKVGKKSGKGEV
jgi:hypothetical protein